MGGIFQQESRISSSFSLSPVIPFTVEGNSDRNVRMYSLSLSLSLSLALSPSLSLSLSLSLSHPFSRPLPSQSQPITRPFPMIMKEPFQIDIYQNNDITNTIGAGSKIKTLSDKVILNYIFALQSLIQVFIAVTLHHRFVCFKKIDKFVSNNKSINLIGNFPTN